MCLFRIPQLWSELYDESEALTLHYPLIAEHLDQALGALGQSSYLLSFCRSQTLVLECLLKINVSFVSKLTFSTKNGKFVEILDSSLASQNTIQLSCSSSGYREN